METPLFDQLPPGQRMPVYCFTLEEVERAEQQGIPLWIPLARVEKGREEVHALKLEDVGNLCVARDGSFSFTGRTAQLATTVLHCHEIETTVRLEGHSSICSVVVTGGRASITFNTVITVSEVTGIFPDD